MTSPLLRYDLITDPFPLQASLRMPICRWRALGSPSSPPTS